MTTIPREVNGRTARAPRHEYPEVVRDYEATRSEGWLVFAAFMLGLAGVLGFIDGIVAVTTSSFYVAGAQFVFSDLNTWGWIAMIAGAITILAAFAIPSRSQWARWFGITIAGLQGIAQLLMIQAYPFWSLAVFAIDLLVIYALAVYGGRRRVDV